MPGTTLDARNIAENKTKISVPMADILAGGGTNYE